MTTTTRAGIIVVIIVAVIIVITVGKSHIPGTASNTPTPSVSSKTLATVAYSCNEGKGIAAIYSEGHVALTLSDGRTMTLDQAMSADGARYANSDESFVFWSKGNGALVLEDNKEKSYIGCIAVAPESSGLSQIYSNSSQGFSLRLPADFKAGTTDKGIKFTISSAMATGTNLSADSYISVEEIPNTPSCSASLFVMKGTKTSTTTDSGVQYSVASTSDAAAGNRYEEKVYAISGTNPCMAVRYLIHYGVFENYPKGSIAKFDEQALLGVFDRIRRTLVVNQ